MQPYLHQLLQDIAAAAILPDELPEDGPEPGTFEAHIYEVERYLHETPDVTLSQHTGLALPAGAAAYLQVVQGGRA